MKKVVFWIALISLVALFAGYSIRYYRAKPATTSTVAARSCTGESFAGRVVGISDGDTLDVMRGGAAVRVRLHDVDAPEKAQDLGQRAKSFTSDLAFGQTVSVYVADRDQYGRVVGDVALSDGRSLNRELVRAGYAWWYRRYSSDQSFATLEAEAKRERRGLWSHTSPVSPWEWRKENPR